METYKYLGMFFDATLSWNKHIDYVCTKLRQRIGVLGRVRDFVDQNLTLQLYNALISSRELLLDYCDTVYGTCSETCLQKLQVLQNKAGKVVLQVTTFTIFITLIFSIPSNMVLLSSVIWFMISN